MKGLILAGGHGTRLRPITHTSNKHLIPLANTPMLFYPIKTLKEAGITDIGIIVGHTPERIKEIKDAVGDGSKFGIKVSYIEQDAPRGLAHAVKVAKDFLMKNNPDQKFVVHLGDNILKGGISKYIQKFKNKDVDCVILLKDMPDPSRFGVAEVNNGKVIKLVEKPKTKISNLALVGIYMFNESVFDSIQKLKPSFRHEYEITEAIQGLIDARKTVEYFIVDSSWWKDPGDPEGILEANRLILDELKPFNKGVIEKGAKVTGKVGIEEGTVIRTGSSVIGPVIIGKNCIVGKNTQIGPYTSIGDNCIIENAEIESSILIGDSKIDCKQKIVDSLLGKNVTITSENTRKRESKFVVGENSIIVI